jgi:hypothetical protein
MNRKLRTAALLLTGPAVLGLGLTAAAPASAVAAPHPGAAGPAVVCATATPVVIDGFAFDPAAIPPGDSSTADLISTNCTAGILTTQEEWTGQWISATGSGIAAGCPVLDPLLRDVTYQPGQELAENTVYEVPAGCEAAELAVTVKISIPTGSSTATATATAYLKIEQIVAGQ